MRKGVTLTYQDIAAYTEVTGIALSSFEIEALFRMDRAVSDFHGERLKNA